MTSTTVLLLNGPNLHRLGTRQPEIYGKDTLESIGHECAALGRELGVATQMRQTNVESELIEWIYEALDEGHPVVLNPAAFTHYSYALRDAIAQLTSQGGILVEIHLSNPHAREEFRHTSVVSAVATGTIAGFGKDSYLLGLRAAVDAFNAR